MQSRVSNLTCAGVDTKSGQRGYESQTFDSSDRHREVSRFTPSAQNEYKYRPTNERLPSAMDALPNDSRHALTANDTFDGTYRRTQENLRYATDVHPDEAGDLARKYGVEYTAAPHRGDTYGHLKPASSTDTNVAFTQIGGHQDSHQYSKPSRPQTAGSEFGTSRTAPYAKDVSSSQWTQDMPVKRFPWHA